MLIEGSEEEVDLFVTDWLKDLIDISKECVKRGESVEKKFEETMKLLQELSEACAFAQGDVEKKKIELEKNKEFEMERKKMQQERKEKRTEESEKLRKNWEKQMDYFEKQMASDSSLTAKTFSNCAQIGVEALATIPLGFAKMGGAVVGSSFNFAKKATTSLFSAAKTKESTDDAEEDLIPEIPKLRECADNIKEYSNLLVSLHQPGDLTTNPKKLIPGDVIRTKATVNAIMNQLKGYNGVQRTQVEKYEEKSSQILKIITSEMNVASSGFDANQLIDLNVDLETAIVEIQMYFANRGVAAPFVRAPHIDEDASNNRLDAVAEHSKNYRYRVDVARAQLEGARVQYQENSKKLEESSEVLVEIIGEISKMDISYGDLNPIKELLNKSVLALEQVQAQWSNLVDFFNHVSSLISCCMHMKMDKFQKDTNKIQGCDLRQNHIRDLLFKNASNAHLFATQVCKMSSTYMEISNKHIMGPVASLGELMALKDAEEIEKMQTDLTERMKAASVDIKTIVHERMGSFEERVDARLEEFRIELDKLPPPAPEHPMITSAKEKAEREARAHQRIDDYF